MLSERRIIRGEISKKLIGEYGLQQTIYDLGEVAESNAIEFEMKTVAEIRHPMAYLESFPEFIPFPLKWWQRILRRLHVKRYLRITFRLEPVEKYEVKIKTQEFEFPEDLMNSILLQREYWEKQNLEPTKLLVSRDAYIEIMERAQKEARFNPSNFSGMKVFGLTVMVSPFFTGKIALVS